VVRSARRAGYGVADRVEILAVDDGSTDGTGTVLDELAARLPELQVLRHARNRGYGPALRTGFEAARADWVFYTDADGQFRLGDLPRLVPPVLAGFPVVSGFREPRRDAWPRRLNGRVWSRLTSALLGHPLRDVNCAFKLFPRSFLQSAPTRATAAAFPAELIAAAAARGLPIAEVPVPHYPRRNGRPTGNRPDVVGRGLWELGSLALARLRERSGSDDDDLSCSPSSS